MTQEQLNKGWEISQKIQEKVAYLESLRHFAKEPRDLQHDLPTKSGWGQFRFTIPANIARAEALRQADTMEKEITELKKEFEKL